MRSTSSLPPSSNDLSLRMHWWALIHNGRLHSIEVPSDRLVLDYFTVLAWCHEDCQWGMGHALQLVGIVFLCLTGLNVGWDCLRCNGLWAYVIGRHFRCFPEATDSPLAQPEGQPNVKESRLGRIGMAVILLLQLLPRTTGWIKRRLKWISMKNS